MSRGDVFLFPFAYPDKNRPVLVLTRANAIPLLSKVTVAPITSTRRGSPVELLLDESDGMKIPCAVTLDNLTTVPKDQLGKWITRLSPERMDAICRALRFALACECD